MTRFADASIRLKLRLAIAMTVTLALLLAAVSLGTYEITTFRSALAVRMSTIAEIVGRNCDAALEFGDKTAASNLLAALAAETAIEGGAVYDRDGRLFATYTPAARPARGGPFPAAAPADRSGVRFEGGRVVVVRRILVNRERVGTVYIRATLDELGARMTVFTVVTIAIVAGCTLLALFVSAGTQRWITKPILDLAGTARRVTSERNFALRALVGGRDEVGTLVEDFNRMLAEIEQQDQQLRQQQERLEQEVETRTAELVSVNEQLRGSVQRAERHADQIAQLTALGQLLQSCHTAAEAFGVVQHAMRKLFPTDSGSLLVLNSSGNLMETMATWGTGTAEHPVFGPDDCWAFRRGRVHLVTEPDSPLRCPHLAADDRSISACLPMTAQGDILGVLHFGFAPGPQPETLDADGVLRSTHGRLAVALAEQIALALANLRLREALRNQSIVDSLTGLFNRRFLEESLERECRRAIRSKRPLTLLMLDVDHFKRFNDTWGHECGDAVLRELAALMHVHFRGDDVACRYGGEEFVMLLADAPMEHAYRRAEDLRQLVHQLTVRHMNQPVGPITISIGLASLPEHGTTPAALVEAADRALYQAKQSGRDRTACAAAPDAVPARAASAEADVRGLA